jgi:hypothetical protein
LPHIPEHLDLPIYSEVLGAGSRESSVEAIVSYRTVTSRKPGKEPDFKVEDEYSVNFGDLDEEISKLTKPEPLSSKASFGLVFDTTSCTKDLE